LSPFATIELTNLVLHTHVGTYAQNNTVPEAHVLDMTSSIAPEKVFVSEDGMSQVFDYDPLIEEIDHLARDGHFETQKGLISRIAKACAAYTEITSLDIGLHKRPVKDYFVENSRLIEV
jgi:dihydroneopterin aldolase